MSRTPRRTARHYAHLALWVLGSIALFVLSVSIALLVIDSWEARRKQPAEKARIDELEVAVEEDAEQAKLLTAEYERQRDATLAREKRARRYTATLIVAAALLLVCGKWRHSLLGSSSPSEQEIYRHRGDTTAPSRGSARWRWRFRSWLKSREAPRTRTGETHPQGRESTTVIDLTIVDRIVEKEGTSQEAAIPILQRIQEHFRYLPDEALARVCEITAISPAQISGVSTFYARFRRSPAGRSTLRVCHGTACHVSGATQIRDEVRRHLGIEDNEDTDPRREFTVDEVACLGCCSLAPVLMIEGDTFGRLTPAKACDSIEAWRKDNGS